MQKVVDHSDLLCFKVYGGRFKNADRTGALIIVCCGFHLPLLVWVLPRHNIMEQNKHIARLIRFIREGSPNDRGDHGITSKRSLRKLEIISSVSFTLLLLKLKKTPAEQKFVVLRNWLKNTGSLGSLWWLYPIINRALGLKNDTFKMSLIPWNATLLSAISLSDNIPNWFVSYITLESFSDVLYNLPTFDSFKKLNTCTVLHIRQVCFSLLIPLLYNNISQNGEKKLSSGQNFLFGKRTFTKDFILFFFIWNFLCTFNGIKKYITNSKEKNASKRSNNGKDTNDGPVNNINSNKNNRDRGFLEKPIFSANFKPLLDRLNEIQELAIHSHSTIFEKFMNSSLITNIIPCIKWALWRQLLLYLFYTSEKKRHINQCTNLMKSIILMLGFFVLDNDSKMNVRPGVIRFFMRSILTGQLNTTKDARFAKIVLFFSSNLAFYNHQNK